MSLIYSGSWLTHFPLNVYILSLKLSLSYQLSSTHYQYLLYYDINTFLNICVTHIYLYPFTLSQKLK